MKLKLRWFDTLQNLLLIPQSMHEKFTHLIMKFKISEAVSFVSTHLGRVLFSLRFLNQRLVQFDMSDLFGVRFTDFDINASEGLKG